jgi:hypothetical protein
MCALDWEWAGFIHLFNLHPSSHSRWYYISISKEGNKPREVKQIPEGRRETAGFQNAHI